MNHSEIVSFLWGVADLIRDTFKRGKYQDVILPLTILRRLDCVLAPYKEKVLKRQAELRGKGLQDLDAQLRRVAADPLEILVAGAGVDDRAKPGIGEEVDDEIVDDAARLIEHAAVERLSRRLQLADVIGEKRLQE